MQTFSDDEIDLPADERRALATGLLDDFIGGDEGEFQAQLAEVLKTLRRETLSYRSAPRGGLRTRARSLS